MDNERAVELERALEEHCSALRHAPPDADRAALERAILSHFYPWAGAMCDLMEESTPLSSSPLAQSLRSRMETVERLLTESADKQVVRSELETILSYTVDGNASSQA